MSKMIKLVKNKIGKICVAVVEVTKFYTKKSNFLIAQKNIGLVALILIKPFGWANNNFSYSDHFKEGKDQCVIDRRFFYTTSPNIPALRQQVDQAYENYKEVEKQVEARKKKIGQFIGESKNQILSKDEREGKRDKAEQLEKRSERLFRQFEVAQAAHQSSEKALQKALELNDIRKTNESIASYLNGLEMQVIKKIMAQEAINRKASEKDEDTTIKNNNQINEPEENKLSCSTPDCVIEEVGVELVEGNGGALPPLEESFKLTQEQPYISSSSTRLYASTRSYLLDASHHSRAAALERLQVTPSADAEPTAWIKAQGSWGNYTSAAKMGYQQKGVMLGVDSTADQWQIGLLGGYASSDLKVNSLNSQAKVETVQAGIYTGSSINNWHISLGGIHSWHKVKTTRNPVINNQQYHNNAEYTAHTNQLFGEVSYRFTDETIGVEPFANLAHVQVRTPAFKEQGAEESGVQGHKGQQGVTYSTVGVRLNKSFTLGAKEAALQGSVGWRHASGNVKPTANLAVKQSAFSVSGAAVAKNALLVDAGLSIQLSKNSQLSLSYAGVLGKKMKENSVQAKLSVKF